MKHLLTGAAMVAALAISAPVGAQPAPSNAPPAANAPAAAAAPVQSMSRMPGGGKATSERGTTGSATRAHRHRHYIEAARHHPQAARHPSALNGQAGQADQLNRQELSQLQNANPTTMNRMPAGGRATSGGTGQ